MARHGIAVDDNKCLCCTRGWGWGTMVGPRQTYSPVVWRRRRLRICLNSRVLSVGSTVSGCLTEVHNRTCWDKTSPNKYRGPIRWYETGEHWLVPACNVSLRSYIIIRRSFREPGPRVSTSTSFGIRIWYILCIQYSHKLTATFLCEIWACVCSCPRTLLLIIYGSAVLFQAIT